MRRRAADSRRPVYRVFPMWIWVLLSLSLIVLLCIFVFHHNQSDKDFRAQPLMELHPRTGQLITIRNVTQDLLSGNSYVRQLSDQMTLAKAYSLLAKEHKDYQLDHELSTTIQNCQRVLSKAATITDPISAEEAEPIIKSFAALIYKAQSIHYDITTTIKTLKEQFEKIQKRALSAEIKSLSMGQMVSESLPKSLHCFEIKLMADYLQNTSKQGLVDEAKNSPRLVDNNLYHFCLFSDNVLAVSAVVNSTVSNADHPTQLVFHIVTKRVKYGPMQAWFLGNDFKGAAIEIQTLEDLTWLNASYSPVIKHHNAAEALKYYFKNSDDPDMKYHHPKYFSMMNHLRFYTPEIYPQLEKVVFLDDDVIVQKDLTPLFSIDMHGNVNGAVETCLEVYHRFHKYLNFSNPLISKNFDPQACGWAFGTNVFDLIAWRKHNVTEKYHYWIEKNFPERTLWKLGTLPVGLLSMYGLTEAIDRRWHVGALGNQDDIDKRMIESAAVLHFNGNMKPWMKNGIERYKPLWEQYVNFTHPYLEECFTS